MITVRAGEIAFNIEKDASSAFYTAEGAPPAINSDFMVDGKFTCIEDRALPEHTRIGEFISSDGTKVLRALYNPLESEATFDGITLTNDAIRFDVFELESYLKK